MQPNHLVLAPTANGRSFEPGRWLEDCHARFDEQWQQWQAQQVRVEGAGGAPALPDSAPLGAGVRPGSGRKVLWCHRRELRRAAGQCSIH